ncbi:hypothetical protein FACS1894133_3330 [Clostridia bacterium]|nr:hypothetical protein FACS1894133_3330 [Clostridia bacterium]
MPKFVMLKTVSEEYTIAGYPLSLVATAVAENTDTGVRYALCKFKSAVPGDLVTEAVQIRIDCFDESNTKIGSVGYVYKNLSVASGQFFGNNIPIALTDNKTLSISVVLFKVRFTGGKGWVAPSEQAFAPKPTDDFDLDIDEVIDLGTPAPKPTPATSVAASAPVFTATPTSVPTPALASVPMYMPTPVPVPTYVPTSAPMSATVQMPASASTTKRIVCEMCGNELITGQKFCTKCGQKSVFEVDTATASNIGNTNIGKANVGFFKRNKKKLLIPIAAVFGVFVAFLAFTVITKLTPSVEKLVAVGNYEKAYDIASENQKDELLRENVVAFLSGLASNSLKDKSSFELRSAYVLSDYTRILIEVGGKNSYGGMVTAYWYYIYDADDNRYSFLDSWTDLENEEIESWDDDDEKLRKYKKWIAMVLVRPMCFEADHLLDDGTCYSYSLSKESVKNINHLFSEDLLDDVKLIDTVYEKAQSTDETSTGETSPEV